MIRNGVKQGLGWADIAKLLPGRISEHVKEHWTNVLDDSIKKIPWTDEETDILFRNQAQLGNQWSKIAKLLPGRSENNVKNRWYNTKMSQKRKFRRMTGGIERANVLKRARGETEDKI